jgi:hypothetical protein
MARLWNKYSVRRRDGSVPESPYFVLLAADPAAPAALRQYAMAASVWGMDPGYCADVHRLAARFEAWRAAHHTGDPDARAHRVDDPGVVADIPEFATKLPSEWAQRPTIWDGAGKPGCPE